MLSEYHNENEQAEIVTPKALALKVSCTHELTDRLNAALHFVIKKIDFRPLVDFKHIENVNRYKLLSEDGKSLEIEINVIESGLATENIIFHTDDCLRDYHKYLMLGVEFINRPEYHAFGLQVHFIDDKDNRYTLLEERSYT